MTIAELFVKIGVKADTNKLKEVGQGLGALKVGALAAIGAISGIVAVLEQSIANSMRLAVEFRNFTSETGQSTEELQKWQAVAGSASISADAVTSSIKSLTANREKIRLGQGNISGYQLLGIDPMQDPFKIIEDLKTKTAGMSASMKKEMLSQLGISAEMLPLLQMSNEEFKLMKENAFIIPDNVNAELVKTSGALNNLMGMIKYLQAMLAAQFGPTIQKIVKLIIEWVRQNKEGLEKGFKKLGEIITSVGKVVKFLFDVFMQLTGTTNTLNAAIKLAVMAFVALNSAFLFSPVGIITMGIVLLVAALEDLYEFSQGNKDSFFGKLFDKVPLIGKILEPLTKLMGNWGDFQKLLSNPNFLNSLDEINKKFGALGVILKLCYESIKLMYDVLITYPVETLRMLANATGLTEESKQNRVAARKSEVAAGRLPNLEQMSAAEIKNFVQTGGGKVINRNIVVNVNSTKEAEDFLRQDATKEDIAVADQLKAGAY